MVSDNEITDVESTGKRFYVGLVVGSANTRICVLELNRNISTFSSNPNLFTNSVILTMPQHVLIAANVLLSNNIKNHSFYGFPIHDKLFYAVRMSKSTSPITQSNYHVGDLVRIATQEVSSATYILLGFVWLNNMWYVVTRRVVIKDVETNNKDNDTTPTIINLLGFLETIFQLYSTSPTATGTMDQQQQHDTSSSSSSKPTKTVREDTTTTAAATRSKVTKSITSFKYDGNFHITHVGSSDVNNKLHQIKKFRCFMMLDGLSYICSDAFQVMISLTLSSNHSQQQPSSSSSSLSSPFDILSDQTRPSPTAIVNTTTTTATTVTNNNRSSSNGSSSGNGSSGGNGTSCSLAITTIDSCSATTTIHPTPEKHLPNYKNRSKTHMPDYSGSDDDHDSSEFDDDNITIRVESIISPTTTTVTTTTSPTVITQQQRPKESKASRRSPKPNRQQQQQRQQKIANQKPSAKPRGKSRKSSVIFTEEEEEVAFVPLQQQKVQLQQQQRVQQQQQLSLNQQEQHQETQSQQHRQQQQQFLTQQQKQHQQDVQLQQHQHHNQFLQLQHNEEQQQQQLKKQQQQQQPTFTPQQSKSVRFHDDTELSITDLLFKLTRSVSLLSRDLADTKAIMLQHFDHIDTTHDTLYAKMDGIEQSTHNVISDQTNRITSEMFQIKNVVHNIEDQVTVMSSSLSRKRRRGPNHSDIDDDDAPLGDIHKAKTMSSASKRIIEERADPTYDDVTDRSSRSRYQLRSRSRSREPRGNGMDSEPVRRFQFRPQK
jgi:uncharacterized membrane protein YgcG